MPGPLLQPILTMLFAALILGERLNPMIMLVGLAVAAMILMARRATSAAAPAASAVLPKGEQ